MDETTRRSADTANWTHSTANGEVALTNPSIEVFNSAVGLCERDIFNDSLLAWNGMSSNLKVQNPTFLSAQFTDLTQGSADVRIIATDSLGPYASVMW